MVFKLGLKYVGWVSWFESESRDLRLCARVHLRVEGRGGQSRRRTIMTRPIQELGSQDV